MRQAERGWINIVRNILDVAAAAIIVGLAVIFLSGNAGSLQDSTLFLPNMFYLQTSALSVNRTFKGDRIRSASFIRRGSNPVPSSGIAPPSPKRIPVGCDPAFSAVADPTRSHIYKRCIA